MLLASINVTVDGGTNRFLNWMKNNNLENKLPHPSLITGDLDSCKKESLNYFSKTKIVRTPNQDDTDFTKCLSVLEPIIKDMQLEFVICICESSGRLDHTLGNINTLHKKSELPIFLLSSNSLTWLLMPGHHKIHIPEFVRKCWCSLVPVGHPCMVTSSGLNWNLKNNLLEFGSGIVSTSNKYDTKSEIVEVTTDKPLLWSMGIKNQED